jgi:hypothetical protein
VVVEADPSVSPDFMLEKLLKVSFSCECKKWPILKENLNRSFCFFPYFLKVGQGKWQERRASLICCANTGVISDRVGV